LNWDEITVSEGNQF